MGLLKSIFKGDKVIWMIFAILCMISVVEVFSAASTLTFKSGDHWGPMRQHTFMLITGTLLVVAFHNIRYKWFQAFPIFLLPASLFMLAFITIMGQITGDRVNGAARWMTFFGVQFQPSEIAKMAVVIAVASILSKRQDEEGAAPTAFKQIVIVAGVAIALIAPENLSTAGILLLVVIMMMFIGRVSAVKIGKLLGILTLLGAFGVTLILLIPANSNIPFSHRVGTWKNRIINFANDEKTPAAKFDIDKKGQVAHARIAIASSHLVGKAPGNSVQRDFLSQAFSDFIFAIVIEELGLIGGAFIVCLYIWLLMRAGRIAKKCQRTFPAFLVMGIALLLVTQALLNMMVAVGLFPVTGQPLPLISKGGTSTWVNCMYIGIILSVSRYTQDLEQKKTPIEDTTVVAAEPTSEYMNNDAEFKNTY